jgi:hypothetical protein
MSLLQHFIILHSIIKYAGRFAPVESIQEAIQLVSQHQIKAEIIGNWLYCFTTPLIGFQLEAAGFWHSFKHNAYIYSGCSKENTTLCSYNLDEIKSILGSVEVSEVMP